MGIPNATRLQLVTEGIVSVDDLEEFDEANMKQITDNLRRPSGRVPVDPAVPNGPTVATPPFEIGAKSIIRLKAASDIVRYYQTTGRPLTAANMQWDPVVKSFVEHWKDLKARKTTDKPETPKISRGLPVVKWTEAFTDFLNRVSGSRYIPLAYVVRPDAVVPAAAPPLLNNAPYSIVHGSVEAELIARASHDHALFKGDNALVYYYIEEATRSTVYAASIKPFQRTKNGRGAFAAMLSQYAGEDKWRALIKESEDLMHRQRWKGQQSNYSLEKFIGQHRAAFVNLTQCADHVNYQLPNEISRVTYLLDGLECMHPPLQASMALVRHDPVGKMNDFEATASFLLPHDPVATRRTNDRKRQADVSEITADVGETHATAKPRIGKTGVELRFHTKSEYSALTNDQRKELADHRDSREAKGQGRNLPMKGGKPKSSSPSNRKPGGKKMKVLIAEAVATAIQSKSDKAATDASVDNDFKNYIVSLLAASDPKKKVSLGAQASSATVDPPSAPPAITLNSILGRLKK